MSGRIVRVRLDFSKGKYRGQLRGRWCELGDEGKGRMIDLLAEEYDIVVRYQGGSNAGHTVVNKYGSLPST